MFDIYTWVKALHVISVIFWMAGLLMLPRFFAYHAGSVPGGELEKKMEAAEASLIKIILNPAMIATFFLGLILIGYRAESLTTSFWLPIKLILVFALMGYHMFLAGQRKKLLNSGRPKTEKFYRMMNEVPAILAIIIVILAIVEPF